MNHANHRFKSNRYKHKRKTKRKNIAIKELKDILGFGTPQAIYKWFKGAALPTLDNLVILAKVLDTTLDDLIVLEIN